MERDPARATLVLPATCREAGEACLRNGFAFPVRVLSEADASEALDNLEDYTTSCGGTLTGDARFKLHLLLPWAWKIVHHPTMVGLAKASLGTDDVWCWSSDINAKEPGTMTHYTWHQDATYAGISPPSAAVTVWLCLSESTELSGAVKCIPQSHSTQVRHVENKGGQENALAMGQEVATFPDGCDPSAAVTMELKAGEASVHNFLTIHASESNRSSHRRVGFAVRYVSAHATKAGSKEFGTLVSGDGQDLFAVEREPQTVLGEAEVTAHIESMVCERANYLSGGGTYS